MNPEFPPIDQDKMASPHAQEVEYALILSRMINTVKEDPAQLRLTIYEFARARLKIDTSWAEEAERKRLLAALETAIQGVEQFSARRDDKELQPPAPSAQIAQATSPAEPPATSMVPIHQVDAAPKSVLVREVYRRPDVEAVAQAQTRNLLATLARFSIGIVLFGVVAGLAIYRQRAPLLGASAGLPSPTTLTAANPAVPPSTPDQPQQSPAGADVKTAAGSPGSLPFPLPTDYGVYALNNTKLSELYLLQEQVPDKRIAMSTPINQPSQTTIPDGKARFVVFRREWSFGWAD
jgi:hypothetical protein